MIMVFHHLKATPTVNVYRASATMKARRLSLHKRLQKKAKKGFRGYPVATIAFYGPDDRFASKVAVGIVSRVNEETLALERWFSEDIDVRNDPAVGEAIPLFIEQYDIKSVVVADGVIG